MRLLEWSYMKSLVYASEATFHYKAVVQRSEMKSYVYAFEVTFH